MRMAGGKEVVGGKWQLNDKLHEAVEGLDPALGYIYTPVQGYVPVETHVSLTRRSGTGAQRKCGSAPPR